MTEGRKKYSHVIRVYPLYESRELPKFQVLRRPPPIHAEPLAVITQYLLQNSSIMQ